MNHEDPFSGKFTYYIKEHRDIYGARNILRKTLYGEINYFQIHHPTYLPLRFF